MKSSFILRRVAAVCYFLFIVLAAARSGWAEGPREVTDLELTKARVKALADYLLRFAE